MILVRIDGIKGDIEIPGYVDWFSAESVGFGVGRQVDANDSKKRDLEIEKLDVQEMAIDKTVDSATVYLMLAAMKGRSLGDKAVVAVDVHMVENRDEGAKAYLKIRLENALIKDWNLNASEDARPSESISIWFNKACIAYWSMELDKHKNPVYTRHGPHGWDQQENKEWKSDSLNERK